jgi:hypothetical protein
VKAKVFCSNIRVIIIGSLWRIEEERKINKSKDCYGSVGSNRSAIK